jgi:hypothetical protein
MFNLPSPVYGSVFFTDNKVSSSGDPKLPDIPDLFDQQVWDISGMFQPFKYIDLVAQYTREGWKSNYTYPLTDISTAGYGLGFSYDFPWGGGWFNFRFKHLVYTDKYAVDSNGKPLNDYHGDQIYGDLNFQFPN